MYVVPEPWPTFRVDVAVLFGRRLPEAGVASDLVTLRASAETSAPWPGGRARLGRPAGGASGKHLGFFAHALAAMLRLRRGEHDALQVRDMPLVALAGWAIARWKGVPFFYWMSYPMPDGQLALARERGLSAGLARYLFPLVRGGIGSFLLYRVVLRIADHVFVQSDRMREDLAQRGVARERMTPVPMGVDADATSPLQVSPPDDPRLRGRDVMVYLGTLDRPRRIERLFDMLARLKRVRPGALLVLAGDTHDATHRRWLRDEAARLGVGDDMVWTGWLPTLEAWRYVRAAHLGLSPFPRGPLLDSASPTKVPEYLCLGVPVLCNDNPDQRELLEATGAGRCVPYEAQAFADAAAEILGLPEAERQAMARAGAAYVRAHRDYVVIAREVERVYRRLLDRSVASVSTMTEAP